MTVLRKTSLSFAAAAAALACIGAAPVPPDQVARGEVQGEVQACAGDSGKDLIAPADARVADLARLLHGTWVRRLTMGGAPIETNSFFYFDFPNPETGQGHALMIDHIYQGWDSVTSVPGARPVAKPGAAAADGEVPATTGAYWSVSIRAAPADPASQGRAGLTLALDGDYRGTGAEYPRGGFRFTETGTLYRRGAGYTTLQPWRAPPMAVGEGQAPNGADRFTPVDAVRVTPGAGAGAPPILTYVLCQDGIVDRYYKISESTPTVGGKPLKAAWEAALASTAFKAVPAR